MRIELIWGAENETKIWSAPVLPYYTTVTACYIYNITIKDIKWNIFL
jgi:hypothetical protein